MKLTTAQLDRAAGVLLGTAAGDALGAAYEFGPPRGPELEVAMVGGGAFGWEPGEWTDDTSMAIAIAEVAASGAHLCEEEALDAIVRRWGEWRADAKDVRLTGTSSTPPTTCRGIGNRPTRRFRPARQCRPMREIRPVGERVGMRGCPKRWHGDSNHSRCGAGYLMRGWAGWGRPACIRYRVRPSPAIVGGSCWQSAWHTACLGTPQPATAAPWRPCWPRRGAARRG